MEGAEDLEDCGRPGKTAEDSGRCKQLQKMQKVQKARKAREGQGASTSMIEGDNPVGASFQPPPPQKVSPDVAPCIKLLPGSLFGRKKRKSLLGSVRPGL